VVLGVGGRSSRNTEKLKAVGVKALTSPRKDPLLLLGGHQFLVLTDGSRLDEPTRKERTRQTRLEGGELYGVFLHPVERTLLQDHLLLLFGEGFPPKELEDPIKAAWEVCFHVFVPEPQEVAIVLVRPPRLDGLEQGVRGHPKLEIFFPSEGLIDLHSDLCLGGKILKVMKKRNGSVTGITG